MNTKKYLLLLLCIPLLITGCKQIPKLDNGQEVIVELNGKQFSANELFDALKKDYGTQVLVNMVDKYITEQELTDDMKKQAKEAAKNQYDTLYAMYKSNWNDLLSYYGYTNGDELKEQLNANYEQSLVLENYVKSVITNEDIEKYYNEDIYGEITVRHILIIPEVTDKMTDDEKKKAKEEALKEAKEIINTLNKSEKLEEKFIELAK